MESCVVSIAIKDFAIGLIRVLNNLKKIRDLFSEMHLVICFDPSKDGNILEFISNLDKDVYNAFNSIHAIQNAPPSPKSGNTFESTIHNMVEYSRVVRICSARNLCLDFIHEHDFLNNCDFLLVVDANEYACVGDINRHVIKRRIDNQDDWDIISFNREAGYYDKWALSYLPFCYSMLHSLIHKLVVYKMGAHFNAVLNEARNKDELIPVLSAFNGLALYKMWAIRDCRYDWRIDRRLFPDGTLISHNNTLCELVKQFSPDDPDLHELKELDKTHIENMKKLVINNPNTFLIYENNAYSADELKNMPPETAKMLIMPDCEHRAFHLMAIKKYNVRIRVDPHFLFKKLAEPITPNSRGSA